MMFVYILSDSIHFGENMKNVFVLLFIFTFSIVSHATDKGPDGGCYQKGCSVFVLISKDKQSLQLYLFGELSKTMKVSTGKAGSETPSYDKRPTGEIHKSHTSPRYPGGDYKGLGNMPYTVVIDNDTMIIKNNIIIRHGKNAIFGTDERNWKYLGTKASHGGIRLHPDDAKYFYFLVKTYGVSNTWITVE